MTLPNFSMQILIQFEDPLPIDLIPDLDPTIPKPSNLQALSSPIHIPAGFIPFYTINPTRLLLWLKVYSFIENPINICPLGIF